jgi:hypothetical protein
VFSGNNRVQFGKALPVQVSHRFAAESAVFDEDSLVSLAGLVPVMRLAEQTGLAKLLSERVCIAVPRIKSGSANPAPADQRVFVDIDSLLRPVYGQAKQGASYEHSKIAGKQVLRKGLSPLATTISTPGARAGDRRDAAAGGQGRLG